MLAFLSTIAIGASAAIFGYHATHCICGVIDSLMMTAAALRNYTRPKPKPERIIAYSEFFRPSQMPTVRHPLVK